MSQDAARGAVVSVRGVQGPSGRYGAPVSYWSQAARRVVPALLVGALVGLALLLVADATAALLVGVSTSVVATLIPVRRPGE